jgi:histidinol-phosphatase (PHP family)
MWSNFHTHSNFCDGKSTLVEHIQKAKEFQLKSLGFSSHAPVPFDCNWCMKSDKLESYLLEIQRLKSTTNELQVYTGLEVDYIPGIVSPTTFNDRLDYTIGSIHFVDTFENGTPWEIDGLHVHFLKGLDEIFHHDYKAAFTRYFELTREMIVTACPTVIGHLDKMKIQNPDNKFFSEQETWYQQQVKKTIQTIKDSGAIVEVNTRGIYQKKSATTYPSPWILELLQQENIPITISSDAHHADDLVNQFESTATLLQRIGFKKIHVLYQGEWKPFTFNENGIIL